eukprot:TRINITY_DN30266_c0_g1_i1.p1 TRINITY_DN30266_c0_g1~~TRINITY_DN30266_c0_g1_i1.p1  ORF type:complete len:109 (+),score=17.50 TRINITY_DN30266_c0_g1_i1:34-360(+)
MNDCETVEKLKIVRDVRARMVSHSKSRNILADQLDQAKQEIDNHRLYKDEKEKLLEEREKKLEELRQINADVNTIDVLITESSEYMKNLKETLQPSVKEHLITQSPRL